MAGTGDPPLSLLIDWRAPCQFSTCLVCTLLLAFFVKASIRLTQRVRKKFRDLKCLREFQGPEPHWLIGNIKQFCNDDILDHQATLAHDYVKVCRFQIGQRVQLRVFHPDTVKCILTAEPKHDFVYQFLEPWIGDGLLISKGHKWARNRRLLTPAFHFDILKPYVTVFSQSAYTMTKKWRRILDRSNESLEMFEHVSLMTLDSLMKCIFGVQEDCQVEGYKHPYIQGVYELTDLIIKRFRFIPYHCSIIYHLTWSGFRFRRACRLVQTYSRLVIQEKKQERQKQKITEAAHEKKFIDFLDMLLDAKDEDGRGLTDAEIQAEVDTFMFEGHDTTASGISWCLYNLARHPEYQAKCRDEVNSVLEDREHFTWEDMPHLPFLAMCVKESLRLHPPVPFVSRKTTKPMTFPDGRTVPEDIWVAISIYGCHHNPKVWEHPEVYDPYRFTPENSKGRPPHAFIPFSAGPRNCIGQHFAMHEIKVCVGQVLRQFDLHVDTERKAKAIPRLVLRSQNGLYIRVTPREL